MKRILLSSMFMACGGKPTAKPPELRTADAGPTPLPAGATMRRVTLADVGLEPASLDTSADPCSNFFQYACGGWLQKNEIPGDRARWARFSELDEGNTAAIRVLMDAAAAAPASPAEKKMGDFYTACMDEAAVEKQTALTPTYRAVTSIKTATDWQAAITALHKIGLAVVFGSQAEGDLKDSTQNVLYIDAAGLGLPDRDYYFDEKFADKRQAYQEHLVRFLTLLGKTPKAANAAAAQIIAIETDIAKLTKTGVEKRDIPAAYNPRTPTELAATVKSFDWPRYFSALSINPGEKLIVATPKYFEGLDAIYAAHSGAAWGNYFGYHYASSLTIALPKKFDAEAFALTKALTGTNEQEARHERCVDLTSGSMSELVGQAYVAKYFPGDSKKIANDMVDGIFRAMDRELGRVQWMSETTRQRAKDKLAKLERLIGYPDEWREYPYDVSRTNLLGSMEAAMAFETHRLQSRAGKPVKRDEWLMPPQIVNAYYNPLANNTALPAGILQTPFFGAKRSVAANMGGIGMVIGHELTHGFDDQGAQFAADGNMSNWWQEADLKAFSAKGQCLKAQYDTFEAMPGQKVKGDLTLGENIADLGGVKMAFYAYRDLRANASELYVADGLSEDQQFFVAVGQAWCSKDREAEAQRRLTVDVHSPPQFRVNGSLMNLPEFATAFGCKAGSPMAPVERCQVW